MIGQPDNLAHGALRVFYNPPVYRPEMFRDKPSPATTPAPRDTAENSTRYQLRSGALWVGHQWAAGALAWNTDSAQPDASRERVLVHTQMREVVS